MKNQTTFPSLLSGARRGLLAAGLLLLGSAAQAAVLNLTLNDFPDIVSTFITVDYTSGELSASGFAFELDDDGGTSSAPIVDGTFELSASIDGLGALGGGGTLIIGGTVPTLGFDSTTDPHLLTGDLTALGFGTSDVLEFLFDVSGGEAADLYGGIGAVGGVIMSATGFSGSFAGDFSNSGTGVSSVAPVPVPAAVWLFGSGLLGLVGIGRRRRFA